MNSTSYIELSRGALVSNFDFLKSLYGESIEICSVIKANAYGHGARQYVPLAEQAGVHTFAVFSSEEARVVLQVKQKGSRLIILGSINDNELGWAIRNGIEFYVFSLDRLKKAKEASEGLNMPAAIHLELETGMNRTGLSYPELRKCVNFLSENMEFFRIKGICTHFAGAESIANYTRLSRQTRLFRGRLAWLKEKGIEAEQVHAACSAASLAYPRTRFDMVRVGILQYGFWPSKEIYIQYMTRMKIQSDPLRRIISWKSKIMDIKKVKTGEFVSYGMAYQATEDKLIAIVPVGYSNGYSRSLSNQGRVLIHGERIPVIGMVNMNMLIADVSLLNNPKPGDEVSLIGHQNGAEITVASFSDFTNQLNYEMLTRLPSSIPRYIVD